MILSGDEIHRNLGRDIVIEPFDETRLNPNSYNLTLHDELLTYEEVVLDMAEPNRTRRIRIPKEGLVLTPQKLYLGRTAERTETHNYVPMIEGRSSIGRLGLFVHVTAALATWAFAVFGRWKCSRSSPFAFIRACRSARFSTIRFPAASRSIAATNIRTIAIFSRVCSTKS